MVNQLNLTSLLPLGKMSSVTFEKTTKNRRTIGQIRSTIPGTLKYKLAPLMHKKLLNNLTNNVNCTGIQNVLHFEFTRVISLRVERSI